MEQANLRHSHLALRMVKVNLRLGFILSNLQVLLQNRSVLQNWIWFELNLFGTDSNFEDFDIVFIELYLDVLLILLS